MKVVKDIPEDDPINDDNIPIAVQLFLWKQTTPFMRPRFGKVHESTCTVCFKEFLSFLVKMYIKK